MQTWNEYLAAAMERHRWGPTRIAKETGFPESQIGKWSRGEVVPTIPKAIALAEAMNLSLDEVFRGHIPDQEMEELLAELRHAACAKSKRGSRVASSGKAIEA